jgi:hypothetical protein
VTGRSVPDGWLDRVQRRAIELLVAVVAFVIVWESLHRLLWPLVIVTLLVVIIRHAVGYVQRSRWR